MENDQKYLTENREKFNNDFPKINVSVKPNKGDVVVFHNV